MIRKRTPFIGANEALREPIGISNVRVRLASAYPRAAAAQIGVFEARTYPWNYGRTPPTVLRPVPPQPSSPNRMNFWIRFPVSTSAVYRLPWESMLT
jgi:hypothetical protein